MYHQFESFVKLKEAAAVKLITLCYSPASVKKYSSVWDQVGGYMDRYAIQAYDSEVGGLFLAEKVGYAPQSTLPRYKRDLIRGVNALSDFVKTGTIRKRKTREWLPALEGPVGKIMASYIIHRKKLFSLAAETVKAYYRYLSVFLCFLDSRGVDSLLKFNGQLIVDFVGSLGEYSPTTKHLIILKMNQFLLYLYDRDAIPIDLSAIAKDRFVYQPKLPSYYSAEEICGLIKAIDRANPSGKRDYAMLLLVARLGLRASDVVGLKFENIIWEKELICIRQTKTKQLLELPLLPEIGEAIIDYLKDGRPESSLPYIFLRFIAPYDGLSEAALNGMIKKYLNRSGINYDERQHGPHSLRHSLASGLLKKEVSLPVISGILGHKNTESTMNYLRVEINSLKKCALDVPAVPGVGPMERNGGRL